MTTLENKSCLPCEGFGARLTPDAVNQQLQNLAQWQAAPDHFSIYKDFTFKNYHHVMAFVNALAWVSHHENHHPDLEVGYNHCLVRYTTHAIHGLSDNDFICAAKADALFKPYEEKHHGAK